MTVQASFSIGINPPVPNIEAEHRGAISQMVPIIMRSKADAQGKDKDDGIITSLELKIAIQEGKKIKIESLVFAKGGIQKGIKVNVVAPNKWIVLGNRSPSPIITLVTVHGIFQKIGDKVIEIKNADIQIKGIPRIAPGTGTVDGVIIDPDPAQPQ